MFQEITVLINYVYSKKKEFIMSTTIIDSRERYSMFEKYHKFSDKNRLVLSGHTNGISDVAISPDSNWIISASMDTTLRMWDARSGSQMQILSGHTAYVNACAISPKGDWIVSASGKEVRIWEAASGRGLHTIKGFAYEVISCAVSPDSKLIACGTGRELNLLNAENYELVKKIDYPNNVKAIAFSPDSSWAVSAGDLQELKVWDIAVGKELRSLAGHKDGATDCVVSPDGKWIVSSGYDGTLKIWDSASGDLLRTLNGHASLVTSCAVSMDGSLILSAGYDNVIKLWDAATGEELSSMAGGKNPIAISSDGKWVVSTSWKDLIIFDLISDE